MSIPKRREGRGKIENMRGAATTAPAAWQGGLPRLA
jgi:hypothetical protein